MSKIICFCNQVSEEEISLAITNGAKTLKDIQVSTGACTGNDCATANPSGKCCSVDIKKMLDETKESKCCCCSN